MVSARDKKTGDWKESTEMEDEERRVKGVKREYVRLLHSRREKGKDCVRAAHAQDALYGSRG